MKIINKKCQTALAVLVLISLYGCGGGSDDAIQEPPRCLMFWKISLRAGIPSGSGNQDGENTANYNYTYGMGGVVVGFRWRNNIFDVGNNTIRKNIKKWWCSHCGWGGGLTLEELYRDNNSLKINNADGEKNIARFYEPRKLTIDYFGNIYINDKGNNS